MAPFFMQYVFLNFIKAKTPQGLVNACQQLERERKMKFNFHSITFANGEWFAWFNDVGNKPQGGVRT